MGCCMMNLIYNFIRKDIKEFRHGKKILLLAFLCALYPLIINIIATSPLLPMQFLIIAASILTACFGGELLYFLTINEIKYRIFDIFLLSKIGIPQLIFCKNALPFLCSFLLALTSLWVNNAAVILFPEQNFTVGLIDFETIALLISTAIISTLIQFGAVLIIEKFNDYTHTVTLAISFSVMIFLYSVNLLNGAVIFFIIDAGIVLSLIFLDCKALSLYRHTSSSRKCRSLALTFPEKNMSAICALLRKELIVSELNFLNLIRLIISAAFPIIVSSFGINNLRLRQILFRITLYFVCSFGVFNILFPVIKTEQISRSADIFKVAKTNRLKIYFSKSVAPMFTTVIGLIILFTIMLIYCRQTGKAFTFDYTAILAAMLSTISSIAVTLWLGQYINSYKDARIIRFFITVITFVIHASISFMPFLLS